MSTRIDRTIVLVASSRHAELAKEAGAQSTFVIAPAAGVEALMRRDEVRPEVDIFLRVVIALPPGCEALRDDLAVRLGDERCSTTEWTDRDSAADILARARPLWSDEISTLKDIPDPGPQKTYTTGIDGLDRHGLRLITPAFMPVIGPYGSGKSILIRQLLTNLWRLHGLKFLLTSFEEKVKPRYQEDFRRLLLGFPVHDASPSQIAHADDELERCAVFLRRKRNTLLDADRLLHLIETAVKRHGLRAVCVDPINEVDHVVPRGESKTDYMGRFIMRLKQLADDYNLLMIVCAHPPKDGVEKRLSGTGLLTLNDAADTAHFGNKADIGWCVWRPGLTGPTRLHIDKLKDHDVMGKPTVADLRLDAHAGGFVVTRIGYDIIEKPRAA